MVIPIDVPKRNFDEIDRYGDFDKRLSSLTELGKRTPSNFDEIDRQIGYNEFKKRNFDEIDRLNAMGDF
jgi:hypothetical protein